MPEQLLTVLKVCLLILLYLFFLRVLRAVWAEVQEPAVATPAGGSTRRSEPVGAPATSPRPDSEKRRRRKRDAMQRLVAVEPTALAGTAYPLASEMTIGRAPGCTVVIEDQFVSSVHTRVFQREDKWMVEDLGSTNGTYLNRRKVTGPAIVHKGDRIQVGNVVLEAR